MRVNQTIRLSTAYCRHHYSEALWLVHYRKSDSGREHAFLTNLLDLPALAVADLYRQRRQIETFFPLDQVTSKNQSLLQDF